MKEISCFSLKSQSSLLAILYMYQNRNLIKLLGLFSFFFFSFHEMLEILFLLGKDRKQQHINTFELF